MDVFDLNRAVIEDYERFARSFTKIRAGDIRVRLDELYGRTAVLARGARSD
jgi:hypothetical protein